MSKRKTPEKPDHEATKRKALAELAALEHGGEGVVGGAMRNAQNAEKVRMKSSGLLGEDDEKNDPVVQLGKKIGRGLGFLLLAYIVYNLITTYMMK